jgi:hypothetical protein
VVRLRFPGPRGIAHAAPAQEIASAAHVNCLVRDERLRGSEYEDARGWVVLAGVTAVVLVVVALTQWDRASKLLAVVSTVAAVVAVGVAVWQGRLALAKKPEPSVAVEDTGPAVAERNGSRANTGFEGPTKLPGSATVRSTGRAEGSDGGSANTGIRFT